MDAGLISAFDGLGLKGDRLASQGGLTVPHQPLAGEAGIRKVSLYSALSLSLSLFSLRTETTPSSISLVSDFPLAEARSLIPTSFMNTTPLAARSHSIVE